MKEVSLSITFVMDDDKNIDESTIFNLLLGRENINRIKGIRGIEVGRYPILKLEIKGGVIKHETENKSRKND